MEHLIYVLWHDHWKPWITSKLEWIGYIALASLITSVIFCGLIWLAIECQDALRALYGG